MSMVYDNWERLAAAVLRREELWQLFHSHSRSSSVSSTESGFSTISRWGSSRLDFSSYFPSEIKSIGGIKVEKGNSDLVYIENSSPSFDLEDLLEASWEFIGDEGYSFISTFAATLKNSSTIVVKRLRIGTVALERKVFDERMTIVKSIDNENVAALRGYFFVEDGVLGLYDYFSQGSVYAMLHGKRSDNRVHLDWETRIRIAVGAARGLAYIHTQCGGTLIHGNIKASNVFLNSQQYGCLADYEASLINPSAKPLAQNSGYRAPEVYANKPSQASDVYSFGILLLELLTGRSPMHTSRANKTFGDWAHLQAQDGMSFQVYDLQLLRNPIVKQAMWNMLEIAMPCLAKKPENRPKMSDVVEMLELLLDDQRRHDHL
ncbi:putative inactive receptor kinase [Abeliophyllum distichum]|uniref:Inactive receptor kinase n=1 Tax=Abeliophyllum distichum TaxID=126358 RepID=A0ABD1UQT6_9LAMI